MNRQRDMHMTAGAAALAVFFAAVFVTACDKKPATKSGDTTGQTATQEAESEPLAPPKIPSEPGKFGPSLARKVVEEHYDVDTHMETKQCGECHGQIVEEWKGSAHGFASFSNPFYRLSFDQFTKDADRKKAQHCGGCHDPTLLFDGSITREIEPKDRRAHAGVTCNTCHGITEATTDGNGSYLLSTATVPIPKDGDAHSLAKHRARLGNATLRTNELCVSCHEGFLTPDTGHGAVVSSLDEFSPFRRSGYNSNPTTRIDSGVPKKNCVDCHMPRGGPDNLPSHRFAGGHSTLAATIGSPEQLAAVAEMVKSAASIHVGAIGVGDVRLASEPPKELKKGDEVWTDIVVYNHGTGHTFPGGALDLRDTWIELEVVDADGKVVAQAGNEHRQSGDDPTAVQLHALLASEMGQMVEAHRVHSFRTAVAKHVLNPRDALVARYIIEIGEREPSLPLTVKATLHHRRLKESMHEAACAESKTDRGKEFAEYTKKYTGFDVDPCRDQPIIEIGTTTAQLGGDERTGDDMEEWRRHWVRGLGLLHNVQENLPEAIEAFEMALKKLPDDAPKVERARIQFSLGLAAARQGRTPDAMDWWDKAEKLVGEQAAIHFARGNVHQRTFENEKATEWYQKAAALVDDDRVWRSLAISAGSVNKARIAYDAALAGLKHEPRDPHLLRSQMLSLRKLGAKDEWQKSASEAFSKYKRDEQAANIRDKCSADDEKCREEREPMRIIELQGR